MPEPKAREQFVKDFLLVAENDQQVYNEYMELVKSKGTMKAGEEIREEFEGFIFSLAGQQDEKGNEFGALLLRQLLIGWGFEAYYKIAERFEENN
jgi:hypothetical protein